MVAGKLAAAALGFVLVKHVDSVVFSSTKPRVAYGVKGSARRLSGKFMNFCGGGRVSEYIILFDYCWGGGGFRIL